MPARDRRAGERLTKALLALPGVADVRGAGPAPRGRARAGARRRRPSRARCLERGLVVNAVTPTALRLAPSLLVTDAEIDEAVAHPRRRS